jgi:hypothetical protein
VPATLDHVRPVRPVAADVAVRAGVRRRATQDPRIAAYVSWHGDGERRARWRPARCMSLGCSPAASNCSAQRRSHEYA